MKERQSVIAVMQERYRKAGKKLKRQILDECCQLTGYNRAYASHVLSHYKPTSKRKKKTQGPSVGKKTATAYYDGKVKQALVITWMIMDCICGKRLQPILSEIIPILEKHRELKLAREVREKLLKISSATINRLLAEEKKTVIDRLYSAWHVACLEALTGIRIISSEGSLTLTYLPAASIFLSV
jgi:hypothetical protein